MFYKQFVLLMAQLLYQNRAELIVDGKVIVIEKKDDRWHLSSKIYSEVPKGLELEGKRRFQWESKHVYLKNEHGTLCLVQEVPSGTRYVYFKQLIKNYLSLIAFWEDQVQEMALAHH